MTSESTIRAAILGAGLMGRWHADAIQRVGGTVAIIADPDHDKAAHLAEEYGASSTARIAEALSRQLVDVVHVTSPAEDHPYGIRAALESGLHVLAEKPLAPSAAVTAELYSLATTKGLCLCPVHQTLFQRGVEKIVRDRHRLGRIRSFSAVIFTAGANGGDEVARDSLVSEIVPHPLSVAARVLPGGISGTRWQAARAAAGEAQIVGIRDGVMVSISISTRARPPRNTITITGESGSMDADLFHGFATGEERKLTRVAKVARPFSNAAGTLSAATTNLIRRAARREQAFPGLRELVGRFYDAVRSGGAPPITVAETLDVAAERDTIIRALRLDGARI